jgi:hypothetical protein
MTSGYTSRSTRTRKIVVDGRGFVKAPAESNNKYLVASCAHATGLTCTSMDDYRRRRIVVDETTLLM